MNDAIETARRGRSLSDEYVVTSQKCGYIEAGSRAVQQYLQAGCYLTFRVSEREPAIYVLVSGMTNELEPIDGEELETIAVLPPDGSDDPDDHR